MALDSAHAKHCRMSLSDPERLAERLSESPKLTNVAPNSSHVCLWPFKLYWMNITEAFGSWYTVCGSRPCLLVPKHVPSYLIQQATRHIDIPNELRFVNICCIYFKALEYGRLKHSGTIPVYAKMFPSLRHHISHQIYQNWSVLHRAFFVLCEGPKKYCLFFWFEIRAIWLCISNSDKTLLEVMFWLNLKNSI